MAVLSPLQSYVIDLPAPIESASDSLIIRGNMFDLVHDLRKQWLRRRGISYAQSVYREWIEGYQSDEQMRQRIANGPLSKRAWFDDPFSVGYSVQWQKIGANDAIAGRIRAKKFQSHSYNMGWWNLMVERHNIGWRHRSLDEAFAEMQRLYWDKIKDGRSHEYYSA